LHVFFGGQQLNQLHPRFDRPGFDQSFLEGQFAHTRMNEDFLARRFAVGIACGAVQKLSHTIEIFCFDGDFRRAILRFKTRCSQSRGQIVIHSARILIAIQRHGI